MTAVVRIDVEPKLYLRDPGDTELGRSIVSNSIVLIDKLGFEEFTFKKLADYINSTEASVYRYFKSKHHLLEYLVAWYWSWLEYLIKFKTTNIKDPRKKLKILIKILMESTKDDPATDFVDEAILHKIVINYSMRAYSAKGGGRKQSESPVKSYSSLSECASSIFKELNPRYRYCKSLFITLVTATHRLIFFSENFSKITDFTVKRRSKNEMAVFLETLVLSALGCK
ncbi:MAG: TetR/AcrR family transcriptional regulator [Candidatus Dadabacteria bacterium]|nr:MAG: TetR/AcrR family transcriptional regulator [Candidatus Dadabacteria bacterium]